LEPLKKAYTPSTAKFPEVSPYSFAINNPIKFIDVYGFGPGDGLLRIYTTQVSIETSKGVFKTVYLAKKYYQNVTFDQVTGYKREAQTPNDWYMISKEEYDIQNGSEASNGRMIRKEDPSAFTYHPNGADDYEKTTKDIFGDGFRAYDDDTDPTRMSDGRAGITYEVSTNEGTLKIKGLDESVDYEFSIYAVDEKGKSRVLGTVTVVGTTPVYSDFKLNPGEYIDFGTSVDVVSSAFISIELVTTKAKTSTERAPDTIFNYGSEEPKKKDIDAIEKLIK